ncbi:YeeE/YedE family protein [Oricola cellulosilytica]|uniref:YeeE/YedE family protein n=1 Tax=Oricola cellulosilytica TaxID=1429082 RepID=A0A4R0P7V0_9HYPH|nr:YeeE/YedE family protein [Oricola cellulosilytica]TCD11959.1 YeeE/YedE family protein [Oricola cellulosilytica]
MLLDSPWSLPAAALVIGSVIGFVARRNHFCTMAALERHWYASDSRGLRAWILAAAVALILSQAMQVVGWIDVSSSFYLAEPLPIAGVIIGGVMFGIGMALVGTCGFGAVIRLGGGNLRALVVLTGIALAALAAQRGVTGHLRVAVLDPLSIDLSAYGGQSLGALLSSATGLALTPYLAAVISAAMLYWVFRDRAFRMDREKIAAGAVIGAGIAAGWLVTSMAAQRLLEPVQLEAGSFVAPLGDTMLQIITVTGALPDYGVGLVIGVFLGAAACAWTSNDMRWEACDDARELGRHLTGAFLMGTGGIFALGCTIGQGVSAVSVMAVSAPLAWISIAFGARIGLAYLLEGSPFAFMRSHASAGHPAE